MWVYVYDQLRGVKMFGDFELEKSVIWVIELFHAVGELSFIALSDLTVFTEHLWLFLDFVLLGIFLSLFLLFLLSHLHIHFPSHLLGIGSLHLSLLLLGHMLLQFLPLFLFLLLFSLLHFPQLNLHK